MPSASPSALTFGDLLKQLRRRAGMTQGELAAQVGFSVAQISRLEQNERLPDLALIAETFVPALALQEEPHLAQRLIELAALARGERPPTAVRVTRTMHTTIREQMVDEAGYLPEPLTALIGRERELDAICKRLTSAPGRLLTLIGPPGVGKTRLGLAAAAKLRTLYRDGAVFVALASIDDPEVVASTIVIALGLTEASSKPAAARLIEHLRRKELLLVLDNVEQVTECAPLLFKLLQECPGLRILVTSTEPLRLRAEQRHKIPPLEPAPGVEMFIQRAQSVDPDFVVTPEDAATITEICLRLDCLPLAIELVAARIDLLSPQAMLARLQDHRLDLLTHGPRDLPAHHRTLRAAIQRSYALLTEEEQALFRWLGVFVGGCDLDAIGHLGHNEQTLRSLVNKSLTHRDARIGQEQRFLLLETLREFALERLAATGEEMAARRRHADLFLDLAKKASAHRLIGDQQYWLDRLEQEHDNLRAAMRWLIDHDAAGAQQLGGALREFWYMRGHFVEGRRLLDHALAADPAPTVQRGHALLTAARFAHVQDEYDEGMRLIDESLAILRACGDLAGCAEALRTGGWIAHNLGQSPRSLAMFEESLELSRSLDDKPMIADLHISIAQVYALDGDEAHFETARRYFREGLAISRQLGRNESVAYAQLGEASLAFMSGDYATAIRLANDALAIFRELDFRRNIPLTLLVIGESQLLQGDFAAARHHVQGAHDLYLELAIPWGVTASKQVLGQIERQAGNLDLATGLLGESLRMSWQMQDMKNVAHNLVGLGGVALAQQELERAGLLLAAAHKLLDSLPRFLAPGYRAEYADLVAAVRAALGDHQFAEVWTSGQSLPLEDAVRFGLGAKP